MRILHTSDWHLGVQLHDASLEEEQRRFLGWLIDTIDAEQIDALIVAGDIFHHAQPSNTARQLLNAFFKRAQRCESLRHVIITAGNHDSASTLDTPGPLLDETRVHVISDARAAVDDPARFVIPLSDKDGDVVATVSALPYIHSWHLGIRSTAEMSLAEERAATGRAFRKLYDACAEFAKDAWPDVPRLATGHLTCGEPRDDDFVTRVHRVGGVDSIGGIEAFGHNIFGDFYDYVALGHIHRHMPVADHVWYAGTPVAARFSEAESPRFVRLIDIDAGGAIGQSSMKVPVWRQLPRFSGSADDIDSAIAAFEQSAELPPYVMIEVEIEGVHDSSLREACATKLPKDSRIVSFVQRKRSTWTDGSPDEEDVPNLDTVTLEELFVRLYQERNNGQTPSDLVMKAFYEANEQVVEAGQ